MWFKTAISCLLVITLFWRATGYCDNNCEWSSWGDWGCSRCCGRTGPPNVAVRQRGICCHNTTETLKCLGYCHEPRINLQDTNPCQVHCVCPKMSTRTSSFRTGLTTTQSTTPTASRSRTTHASVLVSLSTTSALTESSNNKTTYLSASTPPNQSTYTTPLGQTSTIRPTVKPDFKDKTTTSASNVPAILLTTKTEDPSSKDTTQIVQASKSYSTVKTANARTATSAYSVPAMLSTFKAESTMTSQSSLYSAAPNPLAVSKQNLPVNTKSTISPSVQSVTVNLVNLTGIDLELPETIGKILSSGLPSMTRIISSSLARSGSNETFDCRSKCQGKDTWDTCLMECFSQPCISMLTLVSPCLFVLGVIVGSSITCIIRTVINKKKKEDNSVLPLKEDNPIQY